MSSPSFLRRAGPLVLARFASAIVTTVVPLILARAMRIEEYGTYKQLFLVAATLSAILPLGVPQSLYYFLPRDPRGRPYVGHALLYLLLAGLAGTLLVWAACPFISGLFSAPGLYAHRIPLAVYTGAFVASMPLELGLTSQGRTELSALSYLGWDSARAAALTVPILVGWGLHWTVWAAALLMLLRLGVTWVALLRTTRGPLWSRKLLGPQLAYALPFGAAMAMSVPQHSFHQWVISARFDPSVFAVYAVGCFQLPIVELLYTPTSEVLMVHIGELDRKGRLNECAAAFREAASRLAYVFLPTCVFLVVAAPEFIEAVFGPKFAGAAPLFRVSSLAVLFGCFPLDGLLRARGETTIIFHSYLAKLVLTVPLVLGMVHWFGLIGGVLSWLLAEALGKVLLVVRVPRALRLQSWREMGQLVPWRSMAKASVASLAAAAVLLVWKRLVSPVWEQIPHSFLWRLVPIAGVSALFGVVYLLGLQLGGVSLLQVLRSIRRSRADAPSGQRPPLDVEPTPASAVRVPSAADAS